MHWARRQPRLLLERAAIEIDAAELAAAVLVGVEGLDGAIDLVEEVSQPQLRILARTEWHGQRREIHVLSGEHCLEQVGHVLALVQQRRLPDGIANHRGTPWAKQTV